MEGGWDPSISQEVETPSSKQDVTIHRHHPALSLHEKSLGSGLHQGEQAEVTMR